MKTKCPRCARIVRVSQRFAGMSPGITGRISWHRNPTKKPKWCPKSADFVRENENV